MQTIHTTQIKKNLKMGKRLKQTFFPGRHTNGQQTHEKMLYITDYQGNANQNHNKLPTHTCHNHYHQENNK